MRVWRPLWSQKVIYAPNDVRQSQCAGSHRHIRLRLSGRGLNAGNLAIGLFQDFDFETFTFAVAQVLAQQHRCPVLSFGFHQHRLGYR